MDYNKYNSIKKSLEFTSELFDDDFKNKIFYNLTPAELYQFELLEKDSTITYTGSLSVKSGEKCGRSPNDKRIVYDDLTKDCWWSKGTPNIKMNKSMFLKNKGIALEYLKSLDRVFVFDGFAGWDKKFQLKVRVICERAYHCLFMYNMLVRPTKEELVDFEPDVTIFNAGRCKKSLTESKCMVGFNLQELDVVILGTEYAGEMKKGIFTIMHYLMPLKDVLSLHSSVNVSKNNPDDISIFFGLSGTGKTTLSTEENRLLIGDDEHCWTDDGLFNIEGGCYAKCIGLKKEKEPEIWNAIKFGALLENVVLDSGNRVDFEDSSITPNTRVSYPIYHIKNSNIPCICGHPKNIIFLTCDAFGVLPLVSKLTYQQAAYHFISGYTAKIPGTENGIKEPIATFSACYGQAFIVWHPVIYAAKLIENIKKYQNVKVWLVNTGWVGGKYGDENSSRCSLKITRGIIDSIHDGSLLDEEYETLSLFNLEYPKKYKNQWTDEFKYLDTKVELAKLFINNFDKYDKTDTSLIEVETIKLNESFNL